MDTETQVPELSGRSRTWFKPGQSGNPAGRPKGSRARLCDQFLDDLAEAWETQGPAVIQEAIEQKPVEVLKVIASLMPKEVKVSTVNDLSEEELDRRINALATALGVRIVEADGRVDGGQGIAPLTIEAEPVPAVR